MQQQSVFVMSVIIMLVSNWMYNVRVSNKVAREWKNEIGVSDKVASE